MAILLLVAWLASAATLITVVVHYLRGESRRANRIAVRWSSCAAAYAAILILTAMLRLVQPCELECLIVTTTCA